MEELFEAFTWLQLDLHRKPVGLLNVCGFYAPLLEFLAHIQRERFLKQEHLDSLVVEADIETLLDKFSRFDPQLLGKWIDRTPTAKTFSPGDCA